MSLAGAHLLGERDRASGAGIW